MIYENILTLCRAQNISVRRLEQEIELGNGVIAGWKQKHPRVDKLLAVADYFGVTLDELVRGTVDGKELIP